MFLTYTPWKSKIHDSLCGPDQQYWLGVELALKKPWFLMSVSQTELVKDGEAVMFRRDILVATVAEVEQLAQHGDDRHQKLESAIAYFSRSWTAFQAERGRDFSVIVDGISN